MRCPWIRVWGSWRARRRCRAWWSPACRPAGEDCAGLLQEAGDAGAGQHLDLLDGCTVHPVSSIPSGTNRAPPRALPPRAGGRQEPFSRTWKSPSFWSLLCSPPLEFVSAPVALRNARRQSLQAACLNRSAIGRRDSHVRQSGAIRDSRPADLCLIGRTDREIANASTWCVAPLCSGDGRASPRAWAV